MSNIPVHYFADGTFLGIGSQPTTRVGKRDPGILSFWTPNSFFIYCPVCAEIWARGIVEDPNARHYALKQNCRAHGGGSILKIATKNDVPHLPRTQAFVLRELNLWHEDPERFPLRRITYCC